jgi:Rrf2 family transcriptional repressor of oqxAB
MIKLQLNSGGILIMKLNRVNQIGPARFGIAVHVLIYLAFTGKVLSSVTIANQVNSHATFVRRVLALLAQAGIVDSREGRDGGYFLIIPADKLTIADIFIAVKQDECNEGKEESLECSVAKKQLDDNLKELMTEVDVKTVEVLKQYTLSYLMRDMSFHSA